MGKRTLILALVALAVVISVTLYSVGEIVRSPILIQTGTIPDRDAPTIIAGRKSLARKPVEMMSLSYPEAAVQADNGAIYVANAMGFSVERILGGVAETVLAGTPGDKHPSIFVDLAKDGASVFALDAANARVWDLSQAPAEVVFEPPQAQPYIHDDGRVWEMEYLLSSLYAQQGRFLVTASRVIWQGESQQYSLEPNALFVGSPEGWNEVPGSFAVASEFGNFRDAVWLEGGAILAIAGEQLVRIEEAGQVTSVGLNNAGFGGGIVPYEHGWLVGAHTDLVHVPADLSRVDVVTVPFPTANIGHLSLTVDGELLVTDTDRQSVYLFDPATGEVSAQFGNVDGVSFKIVAIEADGERLLMLDNATPRVMEYDPKAGAVASVAGDGVQGYDGPASASEFSFQYPSGMIAAPNGDILVTEANYRIARVDNDRVEIFAGDIASGVPTDAKSFSDARFGSLRGMAFDAEGRLLVVDQTHHTIWRFEVDGTVSNVMGQGAPGQWTAGEIARGQPLNHPSGLLTRKDGTILIADAYNHVVVGIDTEGRTFPFAGSIKGTTYQGHGDYSGDGGLATEAKLNTPRQMAEDGAGNVYIVDEFNNAVRKVTPDGIISTFAGGRFGFSEDGSAMNLPQDAAVLGDHLYVADTGNSIVWAFPLE